MQSNLRVVRQTQIPFDSPDAESGSTTLQAEGIEKAAGPEPFAREVVMKKSRGFPPGLTVMIDPEADPAVLIVGDEQFQITHTQALIAQAVQDREKPLPLPELEQLGLCDSDHAGHLRRMVRKEARLEHVIQLPGGGPNKGKGYRVLKVTW